MHREEVKDKIKATNIERYGVENPMHREEVKDKIKATNMERYGVEHPMHREEVKDKIKATNMERYGVEHHMHREEVKDKIKATSIERYGVEHPTQSSIVRNKTRATNLVRYGSEEAFCAPTVMEKIKATNIERYGVGNPLQAAIIRTQIKATNIERYGVEYPTQCDKIKKKVKATTIERYGVENAFQSSIIKDKTRATNLVRYGVEYSAQCDKVKEKIKTTVSINKYGVPDIQIWKEDFVQIARDRGIDAALSAYPLIDRQVAYRKFLPADLKKHGSIPQQDVQRQIEQITGLVFESDVRAMIPSNKRLEIDMINRELKISIEFNGIYWHRDNQSADIDKTNMMRNMGYRHIVLDETDLWTNRIPIIADMINTKTTIYARKCKIIEVGAKTAKRFLDINHLQGSANAPIRLGLIVNGELVQLMTFGKPRYTNSFDHEMIRLCTKRKYTITGGASKLFKHFVNNHAGSIISYCDFKYFSGEVYTRLGFEFQRLNPHGYVWFKDGAMLSRYQTMKHKLPKLLPHFDKDMSESANMQTHGYIKIPDLGQAVFIYNS